MDLLAQRAIEEAIRGNWLEAQKLNEEILEEDNKNREALNRLARAYVELGKIPKAIATYKKVLKVDPYNSIAQKALSRLETLKDKPIKKSNGSNGLSVISSSIFIEEPGKTRAATLLHLGSPNVLASLDAGEQAKFAIQAHRVSVNSLSDEYIGRLPDDLANRIIRFTRMGNQYTVFLRSVAAEEVKVFIREVKRCEELKDMPSFPSLEKPGYVSFTSPDSIHQEKPDTSTTEDVDIVED